MKEKQKRITNTANLGLIAAAMHADKAGIGTPKD